MDQYITVFQRPREQQITIMDILDGQVDLSLFQNHPAQVTTNTVTHKVQTVQAAVNVGLLIHYLEKFVETHSNLYLASRKTLYRSFYLPKRSGGFRLICAPNENLMAAQRELRDLFEREFFALYHTSAFAYVRGRSSIDAVKRHQAAQSRWFLKTDFSNFFGSTTPKFLMHMLGMIWPFSLVAADEKGKEVLRKALDLCFLDGGLPQGTPISPMLTNLMMIPIDHYLANALRKEGFVYTRYADDIIISHRNSFMFTEKVKMINDTMKAFEAPFAIKPQKTRYGSSAGQNWNLGVMLNKDNQITIGHAKKKIFKAMCTSYITSKLNHQSWEKNDLQVFAGHIAYYKSVEKDVINAIIARLNVKFNVNMMQMLRRDLQCR